MWVVTLAFAPAWWMTFGPPSVSCLQNVKLPYVWLSLAVASVSNWKICLGRGKKKRQKKKTLDFCPKLLDIWRSGLHFQDMTSGHAWKTQQYKYSPKTIHLPILSLNGAQAPYFVSKVPEPQ